MVQRKIEDITDVCEGVAHALKKVGHKDIFYNVEGDRAELHSNNAEYEIVEKQEAEKTVYEITRLDGELDEAIFDYILSQKHESSFPGGTQTAIMRIKKEG